MRIARDRANNVAVSRPNWVRSAREVIEYKTGVFEAWNGQEWRHAERQSPRMSLQYQSEAFENLRARTLDDLTTQLEDKSFAAMCSWRMVRLTEAVSAADTVFTVDVDAPWWIQPGATLILESDTATEAVYVESVVGGSGTMSIQIETAVQGNYEEGDKLMLGLMTHYPAETTLSALVSGHLRTVPEFLADPAQLPPWQLSATTRPIYMGFEVLPIRHNWSDRLSARHDDRRTLVDYGVGVQSLEWEKDTSMLVENRRHAALNREKADAIVHDFMRHKGMLVPFWTGSLMHRLPNGMTGSLGDDAVAHPTQGIFAPAYQDRPAFAHVYIEWSDGAVQLARVRSITSNSFGDRLRFWDTLERDIEADTFISFALLSRFGNDRLTLEWTTDSVATAQIPIKILDPRSLDADIVLASEETTVNEQPAAPADWTDPATYTEIDLLASGVSATMIDALDVSVELSFRATTLPTAPNSWDVIVEWIYYDELGAEISSESFLTPALKTDDETPQDFGTTRTAGVPANTRTIRHRVTVTRDYQLVREQYFDVIGPERGPNEDVDGLQWL